MYQKGFADVDVTFAYKLLKYFNLIPTPTQNWGREPRSCDLSVSDDVERIHHWRNSVCHRASKEVSETELQKYFTDFIEIGRRFDTEFQKHLNFGYFSTFQTLDKGLIEKFGPTGFSVSIYNSASNIAAFNNGSFFRALFIIISFTLLFLNFYLIVLFEISFKININFFLFLFSFVLVFLFESKFQNK